MYSNMDSAGNAISVLEELLKEKRTARGIFEKYICCCFYPTYSI
jgi:hypothetical protein